MTVREAANTQSMSGGQVYLRCSCSTKCVSKRCKCRRMGHLCNSRCHGSNPCVYKTPVRHTLQPLCDLSATANFHRSQRSQQGPRSVPARLQRSRRLIGDLVATKSVAARFLCLHKNLAATDLVAGRSRRSRRPVPDQSPTSRRLILLESGSGYHWN